MTYLLLLSYIKYQTKYRYSLLNLSRIIQETLFERKPLIDLLSLKIKDLTKIRGDTSQLPLF